jgi:ABC-2 type transport system permease protein
MNTPADAMPQSLDSPVIPSAVMSATRPLYWSVRRELWEYRSIYVAPLAVAGLTLVGFVIATIGRAMSTSLDQRLAVLTEPYSFATALVMGTAFIVGIFYCLDALHGERRDRTILFWKSLPVSDLTTVLSKATIPFVVLPVIALVITVVMQWIMLLLSSVVLMWSSLSSATLWKQLPEFQMTLLYHLLTVHVLWYAPIYAWMLLVSGWARRAPFLWASLPLLAIGVVEKIAFNTTHFAALIQYRFSGPENFDMTEPGRFVMDPMMHLSLGRFLATPGLWSGLVVAGIFLAAAVRLRSYQGPI